MNDQLKPCPFCGSCKTEAQTDDGLFWIKCSSCYSTGPATTKYSGAEDNFYRDWNTRALPEGCVVVERDVLELSAQMLQFYFERLCDDLAEECDINMAADTLDKLRAILAHQGQEVGG